MTRRDDLNALAARVETLTGPCRETDAAIVLAICPGAEVGSYGDCEYVVFHAEAIRISNKQTLPAFTASLDAAMTFASDDLIAQFGGSLAMLRQAMGMLEKADATADALSRYVTAASLRALAAQEQEPTDD